jgi:hypothetical protein
MVELKRFISDGDFSHRQTFGEDAMNNIVLLFVCLLLGMGLRAAKKSAGERASRAQCLYHSHIAAGADYFADP